MSFVYQALNLHFSVLAPFCVLFFYAALLMSDFCLQNFGDLFHERYCK